eukprot:TRINITY_DN990_c0_g2_i1.p1 TRINITY_DN990_c0_g2~~TRINITY_DN990_c0_g2_i1.p1  ORF type:complete len:160 (-),score=99.93 TRINITY_DN990_c0_g2_i1:72-551(-)
MAAPPPPPPPLLVTSKTVKSKPTKQPVQIKKQWQDIYPLHAAAQSGNFEETIKLIESNPNLINEADDDSWTPLHYASWYDRVDIVEKLLESGANVNQLNSNGSTPLHFAAGCGRFKVVQLLIKFNVIKEIQDKERQKPIDLARSYKQNDWEQVLNLLEN